LLSSRTIKIAEISAKKWFSSFDKAAAFGVRLFAGKGYVKTTGKVERRYRATGPSLFP
jgi:hypothetical protein